ncbi:MAG TPA: hypothetical protein VFI31_30430 [Pirellulales bacterium]|nr:hypothetical protein [Pirellulales bacterium]
MYRRLCCFAVLLSLAAVCVADEADSAKETLVKLTVSPAAAPRPALKFVLLPELKEMNPGNAIEDYLKCFMEQQKFFFDKEVVDRREALLTMPLDELPVKELQDYGGSALKQADWAARLDQADWQILLKLRQDGISLLIPDVQQLRLLARALKVRFRAEVSQRRYDDAVRTAQTMYGLSRHLGQHITFIGNLVGIAVATQATDPVEELIAQPDSPNLYWALTYMPTPLVPINVGAQGERMWLEPTFRQLDTTVPMSGAKLEQAVAFFNRVTEGDEYLTKEGSLYAWLENRVKDAATIKAARRRLIESGYSELLVAQFPAEQVLLLDEKRACEERHDEVIKLVNLPFWQAEELANRVQEEGRIMFDLAPAISKLLFAQARLDRRIALLRHVEAMRLYAAEHGKLPERLSDVSVPLPIDPLTGRPFSYERSGETAHLRASPPKSHEDDPAFTHHYEITLRK